MKNNDSLFNFCPVPMWIYDIRNLRILASNEAACKDYGYTTDEFTSTTIEILWPEEDKSETLKMIEDWVTRGLVNETPVRHMTKNGEKLYVEISSQPLQDTNKYSRVIAALDVTDKLQAKQAVKLVDEFDLLEKQVLAINSKKESTTREVLTAYMEGIELLFPELACSLMRVKNNQIFNWCSPSLPATLLEEFDGILIGEKVGSCGTAAYLREKVIVVDIRDDERWVKYKASPLKAGFLACSSYPLITSDQKVIATFAIYSRKTGEPSDLERMVIERASGLLIMILENRLFAEQLSDTHELMEQGQELAHFGNWSVDLLDNVVNWSEALYAIYGLDKHQFKATFEGYLTLLHPDDRERITTLISGIKLTLKDVEYEERIIRSDGEIRFLRSWARIKCDEDGRPLKMIGACLDISDWKQAELELQKSNDRYEYISKASKDAIYDMDIAADYINWGDGFLRVFGYPAHQDKFSLSDWGKLIHPDESQLISADLESALNDPNSHHWTADYQFRHINGNYLDVEETGYIIRDENGLPIRMIGVIRDITERQEAAKALVASEKRYSELFHISPLPMWVYDLNDFKFVDVNAAAIRVYGYTRKEFLAMTIMDIRPKEDIAPLKKEIKSSIQNGEFHSSIARHLKKNGEVMLVNVVGNEVTDKGRKGRLVLTIDNTEKIHAQIALEKSERRFKQLIQEGSDLISILDKNGLFKYANPTAERFLGLELDELIGTKGLNFIYEDDRDRIIKEFEQLQHTKRVELSSFRILDTQGEIRWIESILTDMQDDFAIEGIIVNARDVTDRVVSDLKNKETLDLYNVVAKATSDTIWDCNLLTNEVNWNHGIEKMFGYKHPPGTYQWWKEQVHPDDVHKIIDVVAANKKTGQPRWTCEYRFRCADGTYKFVFDRGFLSFDDEGNTVRMIGAMQDITERMNYIREIEQHNSRLKDIAWTQTHLVRAPLARIMGIASLLKTGNNDPETSNQLLDYLESSAIALDEVIKSVIDRSKPA